jgi:hypothetical protein
VINKIKVKFLRERFSANSINIFDVFLPENRELSFNEQIMLLRVLLNQACYFFYYIQVISRRN